nr:MAG TPA: hypothetical protein [Caudoviricetes sp.]
MPPFLWRPSSFVKEVFCNVPTNQTIIAHCYYTPCSVTFPVFFVRCNVRYRFKLCYSVLA